MPLPNHPTRAQQPFTGGLGASFVSPIKRRDKFKSRAVVEPIGRELRVNRLKERLAHLKHHREHKEMPQESPVDPSEDPGDQGMPDEEDAFMSELPQPVDDEVKPSRRIEPNRNAQSLYLRWKEVLPRLIRPLLTYLSSTSGKISVPPSDFKATCSSEDCDQRTHTVLCLYSDCEYCFSLGDPEDYLTGFRLPES